MVLVGWALVLAHGPARAQPPPAPPPPTADAALPPTPAAPSAADVRGAPRPGQESGRVDPIDTGDGAGRWILRGLLWIPRVPVVIVGQPVRGLTYLNDRYSLVHRTIQLFFTTDRKIGVFPRATFENDFGFNIGVGALLRDVFDHGERISVHAGLGTVLRRVLSLDVHSGNWLGRFTAGFQVRYERRVGERFFGFDNVTDVQETPPPEPLDALAVPPVAIESQYQVTITRVAPWVRYALARDLGLTFTAGFFDKDFEPSDSDGRGVPINEAYQLDTIPGFGGFHLFLEELELSWDTRRPANPLDAKGMRGTGGLAQVYVGREDVTDGPGYFRIGVDLQHYLRISNGPRVLELRLLGEMVTEERDEVPFSELPRLGGAVLLRGYQRNRFRDRIAIVGQANYVWALGQNVAAVVFGDVGRVYGELDDLSFSNLRFGFGGGVEFYAPRGFLMRATLASSINGGFFAFLSFDPTFDAQPRVRRY